MRIAMLAPPSSGSIKRASPPCCRAIVRTAKDPARYCRSCANDPLPGVRTDRTRARDPVAADHRSQRSRRIRRPRSQHCGTRSPRDSVHSALRCRARCAPHAKAPRDLPCTPPAPHRKHRPRTTPSLSKTRPLHRAGRTGRAAACPNATRPHPGREQQQVAHEYRQTLVFREQIVCKRITSTASDGRAWSRA